MENWTSKYYKSYYGGLAHPISFPILFLNITNWPSVFELVNYDQFLYIISIFQSALPIKDVNVSYDEKRKERSKDQRE